MTDRSAPQRLQYFYSVNWDMQRASALVNGRAGMKVCGGTIFDNPYEMSGIPAEMSVALFRDMLNDGESRKGRIIKARLGELHGKNLFCICRAGTPCSADVLIELANAPACEAVS